MVTGEEGERLQKVVWAEILEELSKEVPEILEIS